MLICGYSKQIMAPVLPVRVRMRGFSLVALLRSLQRVNSLILSHFQRTADGRVGFVDVCTRKYEVRYLT